MTICPPDHKHDLTGTCRNQHKCSCDACMTAKREYNYWLSNMRRAGKKAPRSVDAVGTRRRLRALAALGWSTGMLGEVLEVTGDCVGYWRDADLVTPATADRIVRLYDRLSMRLPKPETRREKQAVSRAKNDAKRNGWLPPLAWDDDNIDLPDYGPAEVPKENILTRFDASEVQAAIDGYRPNLSPLERREVVTRLTANGWSTREIAAWTGCASRTVDRIRLELDLPKLDPKKIRNKNWKAVA